MKLLKDTEGREWKIELNHHTAQIIEAADFSEVYNKPIRLMDMKEFDGDLFTEALLNTSVIFTMAWCMVFDQAQELGVSETEFSKSLDGPTLGRLKEAVWDEVCDFFPDLRTPLSKLVKMYKDHTKKIGEHLTDKSIPLMSDQADHLIDGFLRSMDEELEKTLKRTTGPGQIST